VIEFKILHVTADDALDQIKETGYTDQYKTEGLTNPNSSQTNSREKFMIGISFDPDKREIGEMKIEGF
jgi:hypothetical protein